MVFRVEAEWTDEFVDYLSFLRSEAIQWGIRIYLYSSHHALSKASIATALVWRDIS